MYTASSMDSQKLMLIVEGNIGAGKSTFLKIIGNALNAQLVYEPHEKWQNVNGENVLDYFYRDPKRWAYSFQTFAFVTRVVAQAQHAAVNTKPLQVLERSVYSDRYCFAKNCFELGMMNALEWKLYQEWFSWLVENYTPMPHAFIYLKTDPEVCYQRLTKRNRSEEVGVGRDYLHLLHQKHEDWLVYKKELSSSLAAVPVLELDCNEDFESSPEVAQKHVMAIADFLEKRFGLDSKISLSQQALSSQGLLHL